MYLSSRGLGRKEALPNIEDKQTLLFGCILKGTGKIVFERAMIRALSAKFIEYLQPVEMHRESIQTAYAAKIGTYINEHNNEDSRITLYIIVRPNNVHTESDTADLRSFSLVSFATF